jgi:hypothetical protein
MQIRWFKSTHVILKGPSRSRNHAHTKSNHREKRHLLARAASLSGALGKWHSALRAAVEVEEARQGAWLLSDWWICSAD